MNITLLFLIFTLINNCQGFRDAMTGQNQKTTDEFLVKKREPLSQPPDMDKIPEPGSVIKSKQNENNVNKILKACTVVRWNVFCECFPYFLEWSRPRAPAEPRAQAEL